jgi:hypothetical protein
MEKRDPTELDPRYKEIFRQVDEEVKAELGESRPKGYRYMFWGLKKKLLLERYGISWKSPADMNPNINLQT